MTIAPDTKNWTWVLDRTCPECGFDAQSFPREDLPKMIRDIAARWQVVLASPGCGKRPSDDVWSPLEYACHVRDVFRIYDERLRLMLGEADPQFADWDQNATAVDDDYAGQDARAVASDLGRNGDALAERFATVTGDEWQRRGSRSDGSDFRVESFARYFIHDPVHHLWDVGSPLD